LSFIWQFLWKLERSPVVMFCQIKSIIQHLCAKFIILLACLLSMIGPMYKVHFKKFLGFFFIFKILGPKWRSVQSYLRFGWKIKYSSPLCTDVPIPLYIWGKLGQKSGKSLITVAIKGTVAWDGFFARWNPCRWVMQDLNFFCSGSTTNWDMDRFVLLTAIGEWA